MPRRRLELDRDEKVAEILDVARRQLDEGGFAALSIAGIARELGIAQNAVYWYFPSRDHLFVAAFRAELERKHSKKPPGTHDLIQGAVWIVDRLAELHPLIVAMHERSRSSEVVAAYERELEGILRGMLVGALRQHLSGDEADVAADAFLATVEGLLLRRVGRRRRAQVVRYTLEQFIEHGGDGPST